MRTRTACGVTGLASPSLIHRSAASWPGSAAPLTSTRRHDQSGKRDRYLTRHVPHMQRNATMQSLCFISPNLSDATSTASLQRGRQISRYVGKKCRWRFDGRFSEATNSTLSHPDREGIFLRYFRASCCPPRQCGWPRYHLWRGHSRRRPTLFDSSCNQQMYWPDHNLSSRTKRSDRGMGRMNLTPGRIVQPKKSICQSRDLGPQVRFPLRYPFVALWRHPRMLDETSPPLSRESGPHGM